MNTDLLKQKSELLDEYFGIHVDAEGNLGRLPVILDQYTPDMDRVPEFVLCLGNDVSFIFIVELYIYSDSISYLHTLLHCLCQCVYISPDLLVTAVGMSWFLFLPATCAELFSISDTYFFNIF